MEIMLSYRTGSQIAVSCDQTFSHHFDLTTLIPDEKVLGRPPHPMENPVGYGTALSNALFPAGTPARQALDAKPDRIVLVTQEDQLQAIPWEYLFDAGDFIVAVYPFVRALPPEKRVKPPELKTPLHLVAVPSDPIDENSASLSIDGEWQRLREMIEGIPQAIALERVRPQPSNESANF
jgi:hypothetical protein